MAGRRSYYQEAQRGDLLSLCNKWLLDNFNTFDKKTQLRVALEIAKRGVQQKVEHSGEINLTANELQQARNRSLDAQRN